MDEDKPVHGILKANIFPSGAELWSCPHCTYSVIVAFRDPAQPIVIVINNGENWVRHIAVQANPNPQIDDEAVFIPKNVEDQINKIFDDLEKRKE